MTVTDDVGTSVGSVAFAIPTPFDDELRVDYGAVTELLEFLNAAGVQSLVINGTTGEFGSLTIDERRRLVDHCREHFARTLLVNISTSSAEESIGLAVHAKGIADGVLLMPPYFYRDVTEEGVIKYLRTVLRRSEVPVLLYNLPSACPVEVNADMLTALTDEPKLTGVKDSSSTLELGGMAKRLGLVAYTGSESLALAALERGMNGVVAGSSVPVPEVIVRLTRAWCCADTKEVERWSAAHARWTSFRKAAACNQIALSKAALGARIPSFPARVRPPLIAIAEALAMDAREVVSSIARTYNLS